MSYKNRIYGFAAVKAVNSNYNADFSGQPRTLPNGKVYATDKALKYTIKHYLKDNFPKQKVFYYKRLNEAMKPLSLDHAYIAMFPEHKDLEAKKNDTKSIVIKDILSCIDIRLFGATFAKKAKGGNIAISIHGPVQVNHGINVWGESNIYSEQITSPLNSKEDSSNEQTTIGRQSKLEEGHYVHHFSVNPKNLEEIAAHGGEDTKTLSKEDLDLLKEGLRRGATYYDSAAKAGTENEMLLWVTLKENSKLVLPNFTPMVKVSALEGEKRKFDLTEIDKLLSLHADEIEKVELYYTSQSTQLEGANNNWEINEL
jgi:CRISPR-associated protein Csh2